MLLSVVVILLVTPGSLLTSSALTRALFASWSNGDGCSSGLDGSRPAAARVLLGDASRQLFGAPPTGHACGTRRSVVIQLVSAIALVHDLPIVGHLLDVGPVIVVTHVTHEHDLTVGDVAGKRAVDYTTPSAKEIEPFERENNFPDFLHCYVAMASAWSFSLVKIKMNSQVKGQWAEEVKK